ncbi:MAG: hypothetical protein M3Z75_27285 [Actinomycetota bacterium]|nr:hypothetical protein [Actinomycetota bacterium]
MGRRLLQLVIPVTPDRRMFRIHDPSVDPDAPGGPLPPVGALISTNREQLWVGSLQEDIDVRLVLEEWDEAPPPCGDAWDEEAKGSIYLRGQLSINMGLAGTAVHGLRLGGGVGDYSVRVYAGNRDQVTRRYAELFDHHRNPLSDEFQQEKKTLEGLERYLVQLWRESLSGYGPADAAWAAALWAFTGAAFAPASGAADWPAERATAPAAALAWAAAGGDVRAWSGLVAEIVTWPWLPLVGAVGARVICVRNGIIA